jgi:hypothetical protein
MISRRASFGRESIEGMTGKKTKNGDLTMGRISPPNHSPPFL